MSDAVRVLDPSWIPLADGTRLCARIWLPDTAQAEPVPAILEYLPYRKDDAHALADAAVHPYFAAHGYASVRVDIRGSGDSDGILTDEYSRQEHDDALEVIAWIAAQPWCTGAVGMMGISWSGFNSLQVAARRPPALKAIITACSTDDRYDNDVHYMGGVPLGYYLLPWASVMLAFNARPPDPAIVGERWRELWEERLAHNVDLSELWLEHQPRDEYWRHGSICEDYAAIACPVLAVSGWADAYVDAVFRMLEHLECPRRGLIGPWGHQWPHQGVPGPAIGFLQEAVDWWDQWLKGIDRGVMDEPMLRAWMPEPFVADSSAASRPGRWIAEPTWPPPAPAPAPAPHARFVLDATGLTPAEHDQAPPAINLRHGSPQTVGLDAGAWCAYGNPGDLPGDQRRDDALSLALDSPPLDERAELFGRPQLRLRVASDQPQAFLVARLCDLAPDGRSTLVTRGVLNLCHRAGHDAPRPLESGVAVDVELSLKSIAYAVPAGHRLRLALSTSYWPWLWPSPAPVTLTVAAGALTLPVRLPRPEDDDLRPLPPPETPAPLPVVRLRDPAPELTVTQDRIAGAVEYAMRRNFAGAYRLPSGLEYDDDDPVTFSIREDDPLSAEVRCERRIELRRDGWNTRVDVRATMSADAVDYHVSSTIDAYEGAQHIHSRTHTHTIPRRHT